MLVDFWAQWCGPCHQIAPILEELAEEYEGRLTIAKLDADANQETLAAYGVLHLPTLNVYENGEVTRSIVGGRPRRFLTELVEDVLGGASRVEVPGIAR